VVARLEARLSMIGHIQFASVPDRAPPDHDALHYPSVFDRIAALGWERPLGAEYRPDGPTEATLAWLRAYRGSVGR
jgi:hydroxypyruvate isomerase